jgi:hypothetical protein
MKITYDDYDRLQEELEEIPNQSANWLPSEDDIKTYVAQKPETFLEFLLWLTFTATPATAEGKTQMRAINRILYEKLVFLD